MHVKSNSFQPYAVMNPRLALGQHDPSSNVRWGGNRNPHLTWGEPPDGTQSFTLLCWDPDAPTDATTVNRSDCTVPLDLARADFFHWVLVDLPSDLREIEEGSHADGLTERGKPSGTTPSGGRHGLNDYTQWFANDAAMKGRYFGYDGPGPPFNDERVHAYRFVLYALDTPRLNLADRFTGPQARAALHGHVLAQAEVTGLYAINPSVRWPRPG